MEAGAFPSSETVSRWDFNLRNFAKLGDDGPVNPVNFRLGGCGLRWLVCVNRQDDARQRECQKNVSDAKKGRAEHAFYHPPSLQQAAQASAGAVGAECRRS